MIVRPGGKLLKVPPAALPSENPVAGSLDPSAIFLPSTELDERGDS